MADGGVRPSMACDLKATVRYQLLSPGAWIVLRTDESRAATISENKALPARGDAELFLRHIYIR